MSVKYKIIEKGEPGVPGGGQLGYCASIVRGSKIDLRTFLGDIDQLNIVHSGVVLAVLEAFLSQVNYHLINGRAVELGQLGSFYPAFTSVIVESREEVGADTIKRFKVNFRPSALLKEKLSKVEYVKTTKRKTHSPS